MNRNDAHTAMVNAITGYKAPGKPSKDVQDIIDKFMGRQRLLLGLPNAQSESLLIARTPTVTRKVWGQEGAGKDALLNNPAFVDSLPMFFTSEPDLTWWLNTREDARIECEAMLHTVRRPIAQAALMGL
ncbi:hypothetical protein N9917_00270 [Deltaproteobacteria bacterium]|nr:hypothetical protein [Deltaproteobacteria bacterium]